MRSRFALIFAAALAFGGALTACSGEDSANDDASTVNVVATTTILGDVARQIVACADPDAAVTVFMPIGADPHDFSPSSAQVAEVVGADIVIANGLGLEAGLDDALDNAAADGATVINVVEAVDPIPFGDHTGHDDEQAEDKNAEDEHIDEKEAATDEHADEHSDEDPHFWFDMNRMAQVAELIGDELSASGGAQYAECGVQVADEIRAAEVQVRALLESVPASQRILVTDHDALGYLAETYGYEIAGTVIPAGTTLAEPSSGELADLVATIQSEGVRAIFTNTAEPSALADAVAEEVGDDVQVVPLFVGSLGESGSGAEDYVSLMLTDAERISTALNS